MKTNFLIKLISVLLVTSACNSSYEQRTSPINNNVSEAFSDYWYQGAAELNRFELEQNRYGELRKGDAILVFVTEDFLVNSQVKKELNTNEESKPILKLNALKKFNTGIYDYSIMSSVFSPVNGYINPLKITTSIQEWCGQTWLQLNWRNNHYESKGYSYFQMEGDASDILNNELTEDGIWNTIRINPELIKEGNFSMIPSTQFLRLYHYPLKRYQANIKFSEPNFEGQEFNNAMQLNVVYDELNREISILFERNFPHSILAWKESHINNKGQTITSRAKRTHQMIEPYWNLNHNSDSIYRKAFGL